MTTSLNPAVTAPARPGAQASLPARLRMRPRHSGPVIGYVDGGWWPRSDDLAAELPALLAQLSTAGYAVRRVAYNLEAWDPAPRRLTVNGRLVRLGGFRTQNAAEIDLVDSAGDERTALVVIPPQADPAMAERALVLAATADDTSRADEVLTATD
jgi:hypothetical protein